MFVGMPAAMHLDEFASHVWGVFGSCPYLVGSAAHGKVWRDVDVRMILDDEDYAAWGFGEPDDHNRNEKWVALCMAFSALGTKMTGLPIDFQIQQQSRANTLYEKGNRHPLGFIPLRVKRYPKQDAVDKETT